MEEDGRGARKAKRKGEFISQHGTEREGRR
jgi:hypothetical protein